MGLNNDCVRDLLMLLERELVMDESCRLRALYLHEILAFPEMKPYSEPIVFYSILKMLETGFIEATITRGIGDKVKSCQVEDITFSGHAFLKNIHDDTIWNAAKKKLSILGTASLSALADIAKDLILAQALR